MIKAQREIDDGFDLTITEVYNGLGFTNKDKTVKFTIAERDNGFEIYVDDTVVIISTNGVNVLETKNTDEKIKGI
jgi:hypothetical protein